MNNLSNSLSGLKQKIDDQEASLLAILEVIFRVSGVELSLGDIVWKPPVVFLKTPSTTAKNQIFLHRDKIIVLLKERLGKNAPLKIS